MSPTVTRNMEAAALALSQGQAMLVEGPPGGAISNSEALSIVCPAMLLLCQ